MSRRTAGDARDTGMESGAQTARAPLIRRTARRISLGMLGLAVTGVALATFAVFSKASSDEATFRKVRVGMTSEEVSEMIPDIDPSFHCSPTHWMYTYEAEPRLWEATHSLTVEFTGPSNVATKVTIDCLGPDQRTTWQRIQDEYAYQKHIRGW